MNTCIGYLGLDRLFTHAHGAQFSPFTFSSSVSQNSLFSRFVEKAYSPFYKAELDSHIKESCEKVDYYILQYFTTWILDPLIDPLAPNASVLILACPKTFIAHFFIVYFNELQNEKVFSRIYRGEIGLCAFIKEQVQSLHDPIVRESITDTLIIALKTVIVGPFFTYCALSSGYSILVLSIINNMVRSIAIYMLFSKERKDIYSLIPHLPGLLLAGAIRGAIMGAVTVLMTGYGANGKDIFYWSMVIRYLFEPQVRKVEEIKFPQLLTRSFSAA